MKRTPDLTDEEWMRRAIELASHGAAQGEVPVGAVVVRNGEMVAEAGNRNILDLDPTAHAEIVALRAAGGRLGNHRLAGCEIYVTIEPCAMCAGAMGHARLKRLIYGAADPKAGAAGSVMQVVNHPALNHKMEMTAGVLEQECAELLRGFFQERREKSKMK